MLTVASTADVREGEAFAAELKGVPIALYRVGGDIHAISDMCTHELPLLRHGDLRLAVAVERVEHRAAQRGGEAHGEGTTAWHGG